MTAKGYSICSSRISPHLKTPCAGTGRPATSRSGITAPRSITRSTITAHQHRIVRRATIDGDVPVSVDGRNSVTRIKTSKQPAAKAA